MPGGSVTSFLSKLAGLLGFGQRVLHTPAPDKPVPPMKTTERNAAQMEHSQAYAEELEDIRAMQKDMDIIQHELRMREVSEQVYEHLANKAAYNQAEQVREALAQQGAKMQSVVGLLGQRHAELPGTAPVTAGRVCAGGAGYEEVVCGAQGRHFWSGGDAGAEY